MLVLRWFLDGTRVAQLAADNQLSSSTAYRYLHEAIDVLAAAAPSAARCAARRPAGRAHPREPRRHADPHRPVAGLGPTPGVDLWWSGKHQHHGGNVQVVTAPDGWPLWTSPVRPGREHDTTCARTHPGLLDALTDWTDDRPRGARRPGLRGREHPAHLPDQETRGTALTAEQRTINALHSATRALAERGNSLLKTTFKALRRVTLCPWRIGAITAAALVLLHHEHDRTT